MDPKEFNWSADQQVIVTNPTGESFRFQVHSKWYEVGAAQTVKMPGFIAWSYTYKLAVIMALAANEFQKWNEDGVHQRYYDKIVVSVEEVIQQVTPVEEGISTFADEDLDGDGLDGELEDEDLADDEQSTGETTGNQNVKPMEHKRGRPAKNRNS